MTMHRDNPNTDREELLLALVEGELDPAREAAELAALDPAAVSRVRAMRRHRAVLRSIAEVAPPAGLLDRVGAVLEREAVTGPALDAGTFPIERYRSSAPWARRLAVAAGLMLMVGGVGYWSLWLSSTPETRRTPGGSGGSKFAMNTGAGEHAPAAAPTKTDPATTDPVAAVHSEDRPEAAALAATTPRPVTPPSSEVDFDDPLQLILAQGESDSASAWERWAPTTSIAHGDSALISSAPLGVFREMPTSLDLEDAAHLAEEGRLVIRVRADRPALAAARLLAQADSRADKGRLWRLMPCPPSDFSAAVESAMPLDRTDDELSGVTVPFRVPMRPTVETTLSVELDPSVAMLAIVQAELESISEGAVILDVLDRPVVMAPPCSEDGGLRRWTSAPSSAVHSVVVPLVVESGE
ncbi:MAG: hypothetical protein IT436_01925 [Phycisphaerales bacterium]|nr:hypothetical protein [Phycisphaerales bacterium]